MSSLRDAMPLTAEFIDAMRAVFGKDAINTEIKKGVGGLPGHFHAVENGQEVGTPFAAAPAISGAELWFPPTRTNDADRNTRR